MSAILSLIIIAAAMPVSGVIGGVWGVVVGSILIGIGLVMVQHA